MCNISGQTHRSALQYHERRVMRKLMVLFMLCGASFMIMPGCSGGGEETETAAACSDCEGHECSCKAGECKCDGCGG